MCTFLSPTTDLITGMPTLRSDNVKKLDHIQESILLVDFTKLSSARIRFFWQKYIKKEQIMQKKSIDKEV